MTKYDTVYFWTGATWLAVDDGGQPLTPEQVESILSKLKAEGFSAVRGKLSIGAPEGPPR